jgi:hypothetical protein
MMIARILALFALFASTASAFVPAASSAGMYTVDAMMMRPEPMNEALLRHSSRWRNSWVVQKNWIVR